MLRAGDGADGRIENNLICVFAESETAYPFTLKDDSFIIEENLYCSPEYGDIPEGNATGVYIMSLSAVYDGTPRFPDIFSSGELEVSYTLDGKEVIPVDAGTYLVTLTTGQRIFRFILRLKRRLQRSMKILRVNIRGKRYRCLWKTRFLCRTVR